MKAIGGLHPQFRTYERQECFVGHSREAPWREDILGACADVLPVFGLEPWYAADHPEPTKSLRDKVVEMIANSRYGIYDLSLWQDKSGQWHAPRNVDIELGMAIMLNRPALLLRHTSNKTLPMPVCLQGIELLEFAGVETLRKALKHRLPHWFDVPPDRDWLNRFCLFGNRTCHFREEHPRARQWGEGTLSCHIADGLEKDGPSFQEAERDEIRGAFADVLGRYTDLAFRYLDELPPTDDYQYLLCGCCQTVRSTPFAVYRIEPRTPAEVFVTIGMSIALETLFEYDIPRVLLTRQEQDLPSLLHGYEVAETVNSSEIRKRLKTFIPAALRKVRETAWKPSLLPFIEAVIHAEPAAGEGAYVLVVDDNRANRQRLVQLLRANGIKAIEAATNAQALDLLSGSGMSFSLVTTDALRRPERDGEEGYAGLDLIRHVNQQYPHLPVLLISHDAREWLRVQAPDLRVRGALGKAVSDEETVAAIQRVLAGEALPNPWLGQSGGATILLADNDLVYAHSMSALLELQDYQVVQVASVEEATKKLDDIRVDLVLVDLRLANDDDPYDISGLAVAKDAADKEVPCIVITSFPTAEEARLVLRSRGAGPPLAVDYVSRAGGPQAILDAIERGLRSYRRERQEETSSNIMVDLEQARVWLKGKPLPLSRYQYALLAACRRGQTSPQAGLMID